MTENKKLPSLKKIKGLKTLMIAGYAIIIVVSILTVSALAVNKTDRVLKNKVSSMASSLNVQMKLNMDSYISRMETIATLAFAQEEAYTYDATDSSNDKYSALNTEKLISDRLYSLCIMENFVDYGIVYRNNHTVGKISNGTTDLFGENLFNGLNSMVTRQRTSDGWYTGYENNFKRIYYVKRIHENALLVISFYASELEGVFDNPETMSDMTIRLTDKNNNIIYSSAMGEVGNQLPNEILERSGERNSATIIDNEYLITINSCGDDWFVICSIPTSIILNEKNEMRIYIYLIALFSAVVAVFIGIKLSLMLTAPIEDFVSNLNVKAHIDQLTGILNKLSFEESSKLKLTSEQNQNHALIIIDLDNFKGVNDTLGHAYGDIVLANVGNILRKTFSKEDLLGRIGGDEFCVLLNVSPPKNMNYHEFARTKCEELCEEFRNNYTGDDGKYKISASIGVSLFPSDGQTFEELYSSSDKALYTSKHKGKDTYTFFSELENSTEVSKT